MKEFVPSRKPRLAVFELAACAGCQLQILNCEEELVDLLNLVEFAYFKEAMTETSDVYDIALIEGSVTRPSDEDKLRLIRDRATFVGTIGACAYPVGIPGLKNQFNQADMEQEVYGETGYFKSYVAKPVDAVIPVDFHILGCPIHQDDFIRTVSAILLGKKPPAHSNPVCVECRLKENVCAFDRGEVCLGSVTRGGCGAICPSYGSRCFGCRGRTDDANIASLEQNMLEKKAGLSTEEILAEYALYNGYYTMKNPEGVA